MDWATAAPLAVEVADDAPRGTHTHTHTHTHTKSNIINEVAGAGWRGLGGKISAMLVMVKRWLSACVCVCVCVCVCELYLFIRWKMAEMKLRSLTGFRIPGVRDPMDILRTLSGLDDI